MLYLDKVAKKNEIACRTSSCIYCKCAITAIHLFNFFYEWVNRSVAYTLTYYIVVTR